MGQQHPSSKNNFCFIPSTIRNKSNVYSIPTIWNKIYYTPEVFNQVKEIRGYISEGISGADSGQDIRKGIGELIRETGELLTATACLTSHTALTSTRTPSPFWDFNWTASLQQTSPLPVFFLGSIQSCSAISTCLSLGNSEKRSTNPNKTKDHQKSGINKDLICDHQSKDIRHPEISYFRLIIRHQTSDLSDIRH